MTAKKPVLGRGLDILIPKEVEDSLVADDLSRIQNILISEISPNPKQPRREFRQDTLSDLAKSINQHGVLQPIIVVRARNGSGYTIVAGERRWRAAKEAKLDKIPVLIRSLEELEQIELALIENIQRVDLTPLEQAMSVYTLQHQFNLSLEEISAKLGKAQSTISNLARLLKLPEAAREALRKGEITEGHARAILALTNNPSKQEELLDSIINNNLSVRDAEAFVSAVKASGNSEAAIVNDKQTKNYVEQVKLFLKKDVSIKAGRSGNQLIIKFKSPEELREIIEKITKR
jgi:ParB family chromosome partitioning protein